MPSVVMLSVVMLIVVKLNVVTPSSDLHSLHKLLKFYIMSLIQLAVML